MPVLLTLRAPGPGADHRHLITGADHLVVDRQPEEARVDRAAVTIGAALNITTTDAVPPVRSEEVRFTSGMLVKVSEVLQLYAMPSTPSNLPTEPERFAPTVAECRATVP